MSRDDWRELMEALAEPPVSVILAILAAFAILSIIGMLRFG